MSLFEDPIRAKRIFVLFLVLFIIFFLSAAGLGYLYWDKYNYSKRLEEEKGNLERQIESATTDLQNKYDELEEEKNKLEEENKALNDQIAAYEAKLAKITAYNDFLEYMTRVIETHGGFSGWTEGEYQYALSLAQKTQDASFVSDVDWAWHNTSIDPVVRIVKIYKDIVAGIKG